MKKVLLAILSLVMACGIGIAAVGCADNTSSDATGTIIVVSREDGSGTRSAFIELTGIETDEDGDRTISSAMITNSTNMVLTTVADAVNAIGYVSMGSLNDQVKALSVDGVAATAENVLAGTYKLARPFNIAYKTGTTNEIRDDFVKYIYSDQGQAIVTQENYIAIPEGDDQRTGSYTSPGNLSGSITVGGSSSVSPLMEKLIEAYEALNSGVTINLQTSDSTAGMSGAAEGTFDIGMASRDLRETELANLTGMAIAQDGIAVVVNPSNSLSDIEMTMICNIYIGQVTTWEQVKGESAE